MMRSIEITIRFIWFGIGIPFSSASRSAQRLCDLLEDLGGIFIKLGQFLSLRGDLLAQEYCIELKRLLDSAPKMCSLQVRSIIESELGMERGKAFKVFNDESLGCASFAQAHEAILKDGTNVVVKVQRLNIEKEVSRDLRIIRKIAKVLDLVLRRANSFDGSVKEFSQWTWEELDYKKEAYKMERFRLNNPEVVIPAHYEAYTTRRILTMDHIRGMSLQDVLRDSSMSADKKRSISKMLLKNSLKQIYVDGYFHADPHPANIFVTQEDELAFIDFGITGKLTKKERLLVLSYTRAFMQGDADVAFEMLVKLCDFDQAIGYGKLEEAHKKIVVETLGDFELEDGQPKAITGQKFLKMLYLLEKHRVIIPPSTLRYFRTLMILDGIILELNPEYHVDDIAKEFFLVTIQEIMRELPRSMMSESPVGNLKRWVAIAEREMIDRSG